LLATGTGFQNIFKFIGANGAHNNYLHVLMELGMIGFIVFIGFLYKFWRNIYSLTGLSNERIRTMSTFIWIAFCGLLFTMFVGETYWAQGAMFTLAGQISIVFGIAAAPLYWLKFHQIRKR
jgi:O-antigen ligase